MKKATKHHHKSEIILRLKSNMARLSGNVGKLGARKLGKEFAVSQKGAILPLFGLLIIPLIMIAGLTLDYSRMVNTRTKLATALDAALVSAGTLVNAGVRDKKQIEEKFREYLIANLYSHIPDPEKIKVDNFKIDFATGKVSASVSSDVNTTLMKLAKMDTVDVGTAAAVTVGSDPIEVAMALDVTGSMNDYTNPSQKTRKLDALKTAASSAVDILIGKDEANTKSRIAIVPYADSVSLGKNLAKKVSNSKSDRCVVERSGRNRYSPATFHSEPFPPYLGNTYAPHTPEDHYCPSASLQPLTQNRQKLKNKIDSFTAIGGTAGHLGVAWAYYTLSSNWNSVWPAASAAASPADTSTTKVMLLMTDGEFNTQFNQDQEKSAEIAQKTCDAMKADNIQIYSIMFAPDDDGLSQDNIDSRNAARTTMQNCASPNTNKVTYFYQASSGEELVNVFEEIANSIKRFRLVQ